MTAALLLPADYLALVRSGRIGLGDVLDSATQVPLSSVESDVWKGFLTTGADQLEIANSEALAWYGSMREQFSILDMPLLQAAATQLGMPTTWTKELDQKLLDISTMAENAVMWMREAADGTRKMVVQGDSWGIASKPNDPFYITADESTSPPTLEMMSGGASDHQIHMGPSGLGAGALLVGGVAIPWVIVGIGLVGIIAISAGILYFLYTVVVALKEVMMGIIRYWNDKQWAQCVQNAKDPNDCHKAIAGLADYQKTVDAGKPAGPGEDLARGLKAFGDIATTLLWVAVAGTGIYLGVKYVPPLLEELDLFQSAKKKAHAAGV